MYRVKPLPIARRVREAMAGRLDAPYYEILDLVFPENQFPRAFERSRNGGPPGCAMAFNQALRRMGGRWDGMGAARKIYLPPDKP